MAKRQPPAHLTPRSREVLQLVVNSVALGTHDDQAEIGGEDDWDNAVSHTQDQFHGRGNCAALTSRSAGQRRW